MKPLRSTVLLVTALALSSVSISATLHAQPAASATDDAYTKARGLYSDGKFDEALELFRQVNKELDSPNARLFVARCLAKLGKHVDAYNEMATTVRDASKRAKSEARFAATRDAAIQELESLEKQVGRITVELESPSDNAEVKLDGTVVDDLSVAVGVAPGAHFVTGRREDGKRIEESVEVLAGESKTVVLSFGEATTTTPEPEPVEEDASSGGSGLLIAGGVLAGLGVAGMVVFAITGSMANDKLSELEDNCGEGPCSDPTFDETVDDGQQMQLIANVGLGVGIGGLAVGGALLIVGAVTGGDAEETGLLVAPSLDGGFVGYRARF